ncbi:MAG: hypothetical protein ABIJ21_05300 [Nanoarchaeota archaeon]
MKKLAFILAMLLVPLAFAFETDLPQECEGADIILGDGTQQMWVVGENCHHSGHIYDSMDFDHDQAAQYRMFVQSVRGLSGPQAAEKFMLAVNGAYTPESPDDADPNAVTIRTEDMGLYSLTEGENLIEMFTTAQCPPDGDIGSVDVHYICFWHEEEVPEFPAYAYGLIGVSAIAGIFLLRRRYS